MNIKVSDSWLREFIETNATPKQIGECLSLCSQSVEKIIPDGKDFIYDIEITTNRPDCLSVLGIARELAAVLPRFGLKAKFKDAPLAKIPSTGGKLPLQVTITKGDLCPRFTALIYDQIKIKSSPEYVQKRLNQAGIRSLNNVVDISNYLMLELGQPMHTFDYDKILKHKMILRESKEGEIIVTLDGQERELTAGTIIIEDGEGRIVDLCGIMGAKNSETDENTKRVLLFVQTYNPMKIRRACQSLGFRTEAAARFEKGLDPEGVNLAMQRATLLFKEWCGALVESQLFDIYPQPAKEKTVCVTKAKISRLIGLDIKLTEAKKILESLGFKTKVSGENLSAVVPHWRHDDISFPEDLVEEIARIYGYHNLPNFLPPITSLNFQKDSTFEWEDRIKDALKYWGFTETVNYSLIGDSLLKKAGMDPNQLLKIANPLTDDLVFLRTSLIPSLLRVISQNSEESVRLFEMANIYLTRGSDSLPNEVMELTLATTADDYLGLKGILESLLAELGIDNFETKSISIANLSLAAGIYLQDFQIGLLGKVRNEQLTNFGLKKNVFILDLELSRLLKFATFNKKYSPLSKYPAIVEDLSFVFPERTAVGPVIEKIKTINPLIKKVELTDCYEASRSFRITYQSSEKNLTDHEVAEIRKKIIVILTTKFSARQKGESTYS